MNTNDRDDDSTFLGDVDDMMDHISYDFGTWFDPKMAQRSLDGLPLSPHYPMHAMMQNATMSNAHGQGLGRGSNEIVRRPQASSNQLFHSRSDQQELEPPRKRNCIDEENLRMLASLHDASTNQLLTALANPFAEISLPLTYGAGSRRFSSRNTDPSDIVTKARPNLNDCSEKDFSAQHETVAEAVRNSKDSFERAMGRPVGSIDLKKSSNPVNRNSSVSAMPTIGSLVDEESPDRVARGEHTESDGSTNHSKETSPNSESIPLAAILENTGSTSRRSGSVPQHFTFEGSESTHQASSGSVTEFNDEISKLYVDQQRPVADYLFTPLSAIPQSQLASRLTAQGISRRSTVPIGPSVMSRASDVLTNANAVVSASSAKESRSRQSDMSTLHDATKSPSASHVVAANSTNGPLTPGALALEYDEEFSKLFDPHYSTPRSSSKYAGVSAWGKGMHAGHAGTTATLSRSSGQDAVDASTGHRSKIRTESEGQMDTEWFTSPTNSTARSGLRGAEESLAPTEPMSAHNVMPRMGVDVDLDIHSQRFDDSYPLSPVRSTDPEAKDTALVNLLHSQPIRIEEVNGRSRSETSDVTSSVERDGDVISSTPHQRFFSEIRQDDRVDEQVNDAFRLPSLQSAGYGTVDIGKRAALYYPHLDSLKSCRIPFQTISSNALLGYCMNPFEVECEPMLDIGHYSSSFSLPSQHQPLIHPHNLNPASFVSGLLAPWPADNNFMYAAPNPEFNPEFLGLNGYYPMLSLTGESNLYQFGIDPYSESVLLAMNAGFLRFDPSQSSRQGYAVPPYVGSTNNIGDSSQTFASSSSRLSQFPNHFGTDPVMFTPSTSEVIAGVGPKPVLSSRPMASDIAAVSSLVPVQGESHPQMRHVVASVGGEPSSLGAEHVEKICSHLGIAITSFTTFQSSVSSGSGESRQPRPNGNRSYRAEDLAKTLDIPCRRVYDIINILEVLDLVENVSGCYYRATVRSPTQFLRILGMIQWEGLSKYPAVGFKAGLLESEDACYHRDTVAQRITVESAIPVDINSNTTAVPGIEAPDLGDIANAGTSHLTNGSSQLAPIPNRAPNFSSMQAAVGKRAQKKLNSSQSMCLNFIQLFLAGYNNISPLEAASAIVEQIAQSTDRETSSSATSSGVSTEESGVKPKVRRIYEISYTLCALGIMKKVDKKSEIVPSGRFGSDTKYRFVYAWTSIDIHELRRLFAPYYNNNESSQNSSVV